MDIREGARPVFESLADDLDPLRPRRAAKDRAGVPGDLAVYPVDVERLRVVLLGQEPPAAEVADAGCSGDRTKVKTA
jgi:hypothetical protein